MRFRFDEFTLDPDAYVLQRGCEPVCAEPRVLELLAYLLAHRERVVSKEELVERVWSGVAVSAAAVKRAVQEARRALGDDGERQRFIATVHGRGYRFTAPVHALPPSPEEAGPRRGPGRSVAVLPFTNLNRDPESEFFSDGLTEELIGALARVPSLRVASRTSAFRFKGLATDLCEVGRSLGVDYLVEGGVRQAGERLRLTARLVDAREGYPVWSQSYERRVHDVFEIQDDLVRAIAREIQGTLSEGLEVTHQTRSSGAYALYLRGRHHWYQFSGEGFRRAVECFEGALVTDPGYAQASAWLAVTRAYQSVYGWQPPCEMMPKARAEALRAASLDPGIADAHRALGLVHFYFDRDFAATERECLRAIELQPGDATTLAWYGLFLATVGRLDEGTARIHRALELDPLSAEANRFHGFALQIARRYEEALVATRRMAEFHPGSPWGHLDLACACLPLGRLEEGLAAVRHGLELSPGDPLCEAVHCALCEFSGQKQEARAILARLLERRRRSYFPAFLIGAVHLFVGEVEEAFAWLRKAVEERDGLLLHLRTLFLLQPLQGDPRFGPLLACLEGPS